MDDIFEIIMVVSFGVSWPLNIMRSWKAKTAKGKSLPFLLLVFFGYIAGIISKFTDVDYMKDFASEWYVLVFYCINLVMVGIDTVLYFRNLALDKKRDANN